MAENETTENKRKRLIFRSEHRESFATPVAMFLKGSFHLILPKKGLSLSSPQDLKGKVVGVLRQGLILEKLRKIKGVKIHQSSSYKSEIRMLSLGRLDAVAGNTMSILWELRDSEIAKRLNINEALNFGHKELWLHISNKSKHKGKAEILYKATEEIMTDGSFDKIVDKYYQRDWGKFLNL